MICSVEGARREARKLLNQCFGFDIPLPVPLLDVCKYLGIKVYKKNLGQIDAVVIQESGSINIILNRNSFATRKTFTLGHEIGHYVCGHTSMPTNLVSEYEDSMERAANAFSSELIMPKLVLVRSIWTAEKLSESCCVSKASAEIRLSELGLIGVI